MTYATGRLAAGTRWVMLAVARDADSAERWASALVQAGIDAQVRIGDAVALAAGASPWPSLGPGGPAMFAYPLYVPAAQRAAAARVLIDAGWDGRDGRTAGGVPWAFALRGALVTLLASAALVLLLMLRGA